MDDLIAFMRDRLREREAKATAALPGPWVVEEHTYETVVTSDGGKVVASVEGLRDGWHIADNDPRFVLADVDTKRRLLTQFELRGNSVRRTVQPATGGAWDDLLRILALPYANHPDYRPEWRP